MERLPQQFASPDEEIAYLRSQLAQRERPDAENSKEVIEEYAKKESAAVLPETRVLVPAHVDALAKDADAVPEKTEEIMAIVREHGVKNALTVLQKLNDPYTEDEVHQRLIAAIREGDTPTDLREGVPPWQVLHMTLFEIALPEHKDEAAQMEFSALLAAMEQLYAGLQAVGRRGKPVQYALEIALAEGSDQIVFYAAVPTTSIDLFEKQIHSLFPHAIITLVPHDYNIFQAGSVSSASYATLKKHPIYPIRTHEEFSTDPLDVLLNALSKIERESGAAIQVVVQAGGKPYHETYSHVVKQVQDGMDPKEAIRRSTLGGEIVAGVKEMFGKKKEEDKEESVDQGVLEQFTKKIERPIVPVTIRIAVAAPSEARAALIRNDIEAGFHQFENTRGNSFSFKEATGARKRALLKAFVFREFNAREALPLSFAELATIMHVPAEGVEAAPQFKQSRAKNAPAPIDLPKEGTLLGTNTYRGAETSVYVTPEDRLRHFYIIGQTGTGKTTLMKNMLVQDIEDGAGVCMIDPHGTDIADILSSVPDHRRDDVIYFDPSRMDTAIGLNMLEYDAAHPEQKTFVVNELFSIFQKLYGGVPESMGPMFEQYFRNATLLVLDDPESGSTLLDISRVFADSAFRQLKLSRARNPVVVQFWNDIATKAGGDASLENIVPYITSKFDVFTANDYLRPIIGQQQSSFNFRTLMDERKILLVNLAKGRLGDINANLIGMILVGKILMAAMSRVDDPSKSYPPFYLHMDEFQNVMTDSIAAILSEARKYKLGLTLAHQYIAQLDERIRDAVFGNVGSIAAFRVGSDDAEFLARQFAPVFDAGDLMNIENHHAYVRLLANGTPTKPFSIRTNAQNEVNLSRVDAMIAHSAGRYGMPRRKVEMDIASRYHS